MPSFARVYQAKVVYGNHAVLRLDADIEHNAKNMKQHMRTDALTVQRRAVGQSERQGVQQRSKLHRGVLACCLQQIGN